MLGGKRKISACLIVTMLLAYVPAGAIDLPIARSSSGSCGTNVTYSFDEGTATMTISGTGPMSDYAMYGDERAPWCQEAVQGNIAANNSIQHVVIESGVTKVGNSAFQNCSNLQSVELPSTLTEIGKSAFFGTKLTSVTIPEQVMKLGDEAFASSALTSFTFPASVNDTGKKVLSACKQLNNVTFSGQKSIGEGAFESCEALETIVLPATLTQISANAFNGSGLTEITIPNTVTEIGESAFNGTNLTSVTIPASVSSIGQSAFAYCEKLQSATLHTTENISIRMFEQCSALTSVTIPEGVQQIEEYAFAETGLSQVQLPTTLTYLGTCAFQDCKSLTSITLPDNLKSMGAMVFGGSGLTSIELPDSVTGMADNMFAGCTSLQSVQWGSGMTFIPESTFSGCSALTSIVLPDTVTSLGNNAFRECSSLESIRLPESLQTIGALAFYNNSQSIDITIPATVSSIAENAFQDSNNVTIYCYPNSYAAEFAANQNRPCVLLDAWGGVGMQKGDGTTYTFAWEPVAEASSYQLVHVTEQGKYEPIGSKITDTTLTVDSVTEGAQYRVIAYSSSGAALASRVATAFTPSENPPQVVECSPLKDSTLANSVSFVVKVTGDNPVSSLCIEYRAQESGEFQTVTTLPEDAPANSVTFRYDWDVADLETGDYEVRFTATDLVGLESEPVTVSYHIRHYAAPAVGQITLTGQPEYQSAILTWTYTGDS